MQRLERYRGHFYNWYETRTLQPLLPLYVSSVDSGNLAGHLLTLGSGLREPADEKIFTPQIFAGLRDTVGMLRGLTRENAALAKLDAELAKAPSSLRAALAVLERATGQAATIAAALASEGEELKGWAQTLSGIARSIWRTCFFLAPWLALPTPGRSRRREEVLISKIRNRNLKSEINQSLLPSSSARLEAKTRPTRPSSPPCGRSRSWSNRSVR